MEFGNVEGNITLERRFGAGKAERVDVCDTIPGNGASECQIRPT
jgi:hypothetical protein